MSKNEESNVIIPETHPHSGEKIAEYLVNAHYIEPRKGGKNKPLKREDRLKVHREDLVSRIRRIIGEKAGSEAHGHGEEPSETYLINEFSQEKKERLAMEIISNLAEEGYKSIDRNHHGSLNEEKINMLLREIGFNGTYEQAIKSVAQLDDLSYERLPDNHPLKLLIDYTANSRIEEGRKIQKYLRTLATDREKFEQAKPVLNSLLDAKLGPEHEFDEFQRVFQAYLSERQAAYQKAQVESKKPYPMPKTKAA